MEIYYWLLLMELFMSVTCISNNNIGSYDIEELHRHSYGTVQHHINSKLICATSCQYDQACAAFHYSRRNKTCTLSTADVVIGKRKRKAQNTVTHNVNQNRVEEFWQSRNIRIFYDFKESLLNKVNPATFPVEATEIVRNSTGANFDPSLSTMKIDNRNTDHKIDMRMDDSAPVSIYFKIMRKMSTTNIYPRLLWVSAGDKTNPAFDLFLSFARIQGLSHLKSASTPKYKNAISQDVFNLHGKWETNSVGMTHNGKDFTGFFHNGTFVPVKTPGQGPNEAVSASQDFMFLGHSEYNEFNQTRFSGFFVCMALAQKELSVEDFRQLDVACGE